ncbi:MAG TPA: dTDP-4-dehydrorhamnose reductase [Solirubrobacteraceae bacterium]|jgi:dTDP-4-dehydrorhamnose reductase
MRLLITGAAGMLGLDVAAAAADDHEVFAAPRADLDITDPEALAASVSHARPDAVINCAAYTNVDLAERSIEAACAVNGDGAGNVARAAAAAGAWTIHVSSDYVFDGTKRQPYLESDPVAPASAYGRSKLAGERAVSRSAPGSHTIVRSSWLFGAGGPCFPATIRRLAAERDELSVVDDQRGCPTFTGHLARALLTVAQQRPIGIVHVAGSGDCTWFQFAQEIVARSGSAAEVRPTTTAEMARPAPRPAYSVLGTERAAEAPSLPHWRDGLAEYMTATVGMA